MEHNKRNIIEIVRKSALRAPGRWIVGVSGGADSIALAHILQRIGKDFLAVHCNFSLRGEESVRDMQFTRNFCESMRIPLETAVFDAARFAEENRLSIEMACRKLRYDLWDRMLSSGAFSRIAVAHHADDNIETMLLNLLRGTGVAGLRAMSHDTGRIIRPLLSVDRNEILNYLNENGLEYITDSSNLSSDYRRNYLRNIVLPEIEVKWPSYRRAISKTIRVVAEQEKIISHATEVIISKSPGNLSYSDITDFPSPLTLIHAFASRKGFGISQIEEMTSLACSPTDDSEKHGREWRGSDSYKIFSTTTGFQLVDISDDDIRYDGTLPPGFSVQIVANSPAVMNRVKSTPLTSLWLPNEISGYIFRHPAEGDRIEPLGMRYGSSLLSDIMKDARLSMKRRREIWVVQRKDNGKIIWAEGIKRSRNDLITDSDTQILLISPEPSL